MILDILIRYQDYNGVRELTMILYISLIHESKEGPKGVRIDRTLADFQINCRIVVNVVYTHFFFNGKATLKYKTYRAKLYLYWLFDYLVIFL